MNNNQTQRGMLRKAGSFKYHMEDNGPVLASSLAQAATRLKSSGQFRTLSMPDEAIYPFATPLLLDEDMEKRLYETVRLVVSRFEDLSCRMERKEGLTSQVGLFQNEHERRAFSFRPYPLFLPVYRLDLALYDDRWVLLEINTGCPGGELDGGLLVEAFSESPIIKSFIETGGADEISFSDPREECLSRILACYREHQKAYPDSLPNVPTIALLTSSTQADFLLPECLGIAAYYRKRGLEVAVGDLLEVELCKGRPFLLGKEIHLVFRKFSTESFFRRMVDKGLYDTNTRDRIRALFEAYLEGAFCMVNPLGSTLMQDKGLLALARSLYPDLDPIIPETYILDKGRMDQRELVKRIQKGREFVLKGRRSYGGKACILRPSEVSRRFEEICDQSPGKWIAQRRVELARSSFSVWDQGEVRTGSFPFVVGSFSSSAYVRVGTGGSDVPINADQGSAAAPLMVIMDSP